MSNEKNVEEIKEPFQLNEYIKVAKPSIWIILTSTIILIVSLLIWSMYGNIEENVETILFVKDYKSEVFIAKKDHAKVSRGMKIKINNKEFIVKSVSEDEKLLDESYFNDKKAIGNFKIYDPVHSVEVYDIENVGFISGIYEGYIVVNTISPISLFTT